MKLKKRKNRWSESLRVEQSEIPVNIFIERRRNVRASIVKQGVNIRIPDYFTFNEQQQQIERLKNWALKKFTQNQAIQVRFQNKEYQNGQELRVQGHAFELILQKAKRKSFKAGLKGKTILIAIPEEAEDLQVQKTLPRLISNVLSKCFYKRIYNRISQINLKYFQKDITRFSLKYTSSIWGSCSSKGGVTLSSRLLLAPQSVLDYVIVHELTHFEHRNHSRQFWNAVERVMPDYREYEKWLKKYGYQCDF